MILIAGGAGYIGSHVNKLLNEKGYETAVYDSLIYGHRRFVKWGQMVLGDLANREQLRLCFEKYPIEAVMHFGGFTYVGESVNDPAKYYQNNLINTLNLVDVMKAFGVKYFVFSSSCAVYGIPHTIPIDETEPQKPINPYGKTKSMVEEILKDYDRAYGIKHVNLRYFNAAGADIDGEIGESHKPETHLIPLVIRAALGVIDSVKVFGVDYATKDGTCIRDYIHVSDLAEAHVKALEYLKKKNVSDSINLGNGNGYSVREVIDAVKRVGKRHFKVIEDGRREGDPPVLISSSQKARKMLDWKPRYTDIDEIVATAWKWHSRNGI
jgi:UDP-glucose 4-epimerase